MSKKKLVEKALDRPEMYSPAELAFFQMWLEEKRAKKKAKKQRRKLELERAYLL